eukprot:1771816-Amphidinium_carterae.1
MSRFPSRFYATSPFRFASFESEIPHAVYTSRHVTVFSTFIRKVTVLHASLLEGHGIPNISITAENPEELQRYLRMPGVNWHYVPDCSNRSFAFSSGECRPKRKTEP